MVGSDKVKSMLKKKFPSLSSLGSDGNTSFLRAARAGHLDKVLEQLRNNVDINTCNANGLNALHLASKDGHVHVVTELLKRGANVDSATKKGNTALHIASLAGQEEVVRLLVEHGASVNVQSQNGFTPLYMAAQENHDNVVKYLLANGANQSLATEDGFTPLAVAMQQGHDKVVAVLLENDTRGKVRLPALHIAAKKDDCKAAALLLQNEHNPDVTSKSGFTPLHIASHYGNEGIANLLLNKGADVNYAAKHNITPLHVAAKWGKSNMVSLLLEKGANIESKTRDGLTPLHCAARSGHEQVVDMLLERGAPISSKTKNGLAPLHMASQGDHVDAARILLYHRAPVDEVTVDYLTALHVAAHCGHARVAKLLLDRKADPNARALNGFTPLHIACKKNRIKVVELLLKHGASIEATTESGLTPLHVASFMGCMNIVIYLLQNEANPDVPTVRGETPLHLAARANQTDIIRILLRNGAQVDARAREQQTPLHIAARLGNVDIVMLLLQHGAAVDCTTKDLYSALHIAAKEGQDEVAAVLLENGASVTATTKKGFTPLHLAAKYGNMKVARLLLQRDAPVDAQGKNGVTPLHVASHYDHQNVALLLLDKGASPHATAKNGHTPLHIAAKKNQMDIATTLLEYGAKANAESKAGFTPLHLSSQEGHVDMSSLLIDHQADTNHKAKNGLSPLHLCAQEDRVNVASILVKNGAEVDSTTKAGYTPLHVACHFGQLAMVRFLLDSGAKVGSTTAVGYTPLHQAAQQGHCTIVNTLLEHGAPPNATTNQGQTAMSIAQKLGYISVVETLKGVTEPTTITPIGDEKYKVVSPETMQETFMSDSEDEGGEDTLLSEQPYRYLTVDEMKSLGDDSLPIDVRQDERVDSNRECMTVPPTAVDDTVSPQHLKEAYSQFTTPDNIDIARHPLHVGFLVSFLVDARGGAMRGCRHSGVRVIVPPRRASMPMRVTCRYLRRDKLTHPPPLMEGEALASRILELGPVGAKFLGPVMIEVPHFGSLRGKEREIVILRSDNGETWREHTVDCSEEAVQDVLSHSFDKEDLAQLDDSSRTTRILTTDFPHYFAVVTRVRQEVHAIGPEGGMVSSSVVPQVQAVFPQGALTKKIKVGLQAQPIPAELAAKLLGNRVAVSPIVTVEPRRRKFHKPITLTIPKPQAANKGMINQYSGDAPTLRLLCSITGGTTRAQWEDVTGSTPFTFVNDCVSFTTTVSARFWLMDCRNVGDATKMATELYREAIHVPFMAKFVVFAKRVDPLEARLRIFCMTDDKEDKTLEHQEHFTEVAKSRDVEVLEGKTQYIEFAGNLVPVTKSGEQLQLGFRAFRENRLPFTARVKDPHADPVGRTLFMREARLPKGEPPQQPICVLNIVLPEEIIPEAPLSEHELHKYSFIQDSRGLESYQRVDLRLSDISNLLGEDWVRLAHELSVSPSEINRLKTEYPQSSAQQGLAMLRLWLSQAGNKAQASTLESALQRIGRNDIVQQCVFNVDQSGVQLLKDESRDASIRRSIPYSDKDIIKSSESVEDISRSHFIKKGDISEKDDKEEKKYEAEEKEVEEVKKSVSERRKEIEKRLSLDKPLPKKTETTTEKTNIEKSEDISEKEIAEEKRVSSPEEEEPSELSFEQKRLSFEQGKRVIEMKPDKTTMKEVKDRADERFLAEERRAAEALQEKKSLIDETSIPFEEKRKSFEKGLKEEKTKEEKIKEKKEEMRKEDLRRDSALFEGVSQGLVRLDAAFTAAPQVQDLLSPKVSKTPPPSPAEFKDLTGTVAWTEDTTVIPTKVDQSQDWTEKGKPDSAIDSSNKGHHSVSKTTSKKDSQEEKTLQISTPSENSQHISESINIDSHDHLVDKINEKEAKYKFTMSVPNKQAFEDLSASISTFIDNEKNYNLLVLNKPAQPTASVNTEMASSDVTEESQSKNESELKSDKTFVGKMSEKLFGVFKKDDKGKAKKKKGKNKTSKKESSRSESENEISKSIKNVSEKEKAKVDNTYQITSNITDNVNNVIKENVDITESYKTSKKTSEEGVSSGPEEVTSIKVLSKDIIENQLNEPKVESARLSEKQLSNELTSVTSEVDDKSLQIVDNLNSSELSFSEDAKINDQTIDGIKNADHAKSEEKLEVVKTEGKDEVIQTEDKSEIVKEDKTELIKTEDIKEIKVSDTIKNISDNLISSIGIITDNISQRDLGEKSKLIKESKMADHHSIDIKAKFSTKETELPKIDDVLNKKPIFEEKDLKELTSLASHEKSIDDKTISISKPTESENVNNIPGNLNERLNVAENTNRISANIESVNISKQVLDNEESNENNISFLKNDTSNIMQPVNNVSLKTDETFKISDINELNLEQKEKNGQAKEHVNNITKSIPASVEKPKEKSKSFFAGLFSRSNDTSTEKEKEVQKESEITKAKENKFDILESQRDKKEEEDNNITSTKTSGISSDKLSTINDIKSYVKSGEDIINETSNKTCSKLTNFIDIASEETSRVLNSTPDSTGQREHTELSGDNQSVEKFTETYQLIHSENVPSDFSKSQLETATNNQTNEVENTPDMRSTYISQESDPISENFKAFSKNILHISTDIQQTSLGVEDEIINIIPHEVDKNIRTDIQLLAKNDFDSILHKLDKKTEEISGKKNEISDSLQQSENNISSEVKQFVEPLVELKEDSEDKMPNLTDVAQKISSEKNVLKNKNSCEIKSVLGETNTTEEKSASIYSDILQDIQTLNNSQGTKEEEKPLSVKMTEQISETSKHLNLKQVDLDPFKNTKDNDDILNNILIDMLIEQECMSLPTEETLSYSKPQTQEPLSGVTGVQETSDNEKPEKIYDKLKYSDMRPVNSFGEIESLITESNNTDITDKDKPSGKPYVTTPTMQRKRIGGSQRLSREERPTLREISTLNDYSSSDEEASNNYIVTEPNDHSSQRKVSFHIESEDETCLKESDTSSNPDVDVIEMTPSPIPTGHMVTTSEESTNKYENEDDTKVKFEKGNQKIEQRFERMASETLEADPTVKFTADREFQRMVSQLSAEEVEACISQWDEEGLTPSEEQNSSNTATEGDLGSEIEVLPEAFLAPTNPFYSKSSEWPEFEHGINTPSSIFWAFDTSPTSAVIQPNELDIPVKPKTVQGERPGDESEDTKRSTTTRESEEALLDVAAGLQDNKESSSGPRPSDSK